MDDIQEAIGPEIAGNRFRHGDTPLGGDFCPLVFSLAAGDIYGNREEPSPLWSGRDVEWAAGASDCGVHPLVAEHAPCPAPSAGSDAGLTVDWKNVELRGEGKDIMWKCIFGCLAACVLAAIGAPSARAAKWSRVAYDDAGIAASEPHLRFGCELKAIPLPSLPLPVLTPRRPGRCGICRERGSSRLLRPRDLRSRLRRTSGRTSPCPANGSCRVSRSNRERRPRMSGPSI